MKVSEFHYHLPKELIAQEPLPRREDSRMMVLLRGEGRILHSEFKRLPDYLEPGDCLVLNDTKVIPARLHGRRMGPSGAPGGKVEILLLEPAGDSEFIWLALTRSRSHLSPGAAVEISPGEFGAEVEEVLSDGKRLLRFNCAEGDFQKMLLRFGETPLPPYIKRSSPYPQDAQRYQTVYASREGAVAAPTAGLHFTEEMLEAVREKEVQRATLTLHIGLGTFRPVKADLVEGHNMDSERFSLPVKCAEAINASRRGGRRVVAAGTTAVRALETCADSQGMVRPQEGKTDLFIYPGYRFKVIDALLTNFHLPASTLLMLVCAFAGTEFVLRAYEEAVKQRYRFYSYGDCMLILP